jgi:hypothetical protein
MNQKLTGRIAFGKVIKGGQVTVSSRQKLSGEGDHSHAEGENGEQPVILVNKKGDVVESIEVICTCGRTILAYLDYGEETKG